MLSGNPEGHDEFSGVEQEEYSQDLGQGHIAALRTGRRRTDRRRSDGRRTTGRDRRRRQRSVPIHNITVDWTPVTFRSARQTSNILSCPVSELFVCTTTTTVDVAVPLSNGCVVSVPVPQTTVFPVVCTSQAPPTLVPLPVIACPFPGLDTDAEPLGFPLF